MKSQFIGLACVLAVAGCDRGSALCIDSVLCAQGAHWDANKCACVTDGDAGGCVQTVQCTTQAHWDPVACGCVLDQGGADGGCVDNIQCVMGAHWDGALCKCVFDGDMATSCNTSCGGGGTGCPSMCSSCNAGELCCAWSGGACLITDAGTCASNGGFSCAKPTAAGVCPNQCYP
ncbi:MAG TPA: hypothetical protein VFF06_14510 [Polyangia bacterium]|nr:hypothetical protein [Polyangia bacterium]